MSVQTIETTAGQVKAELERRGINPAVPVTVTINPISKMLWAARAASRANVVAAGLSDADIDKLIKQARADVAVDQA
jgi:hypothetical protein